MSFDEVVHYLRLGGPTMAFILASSVLALGVAIERLIALWGVSEKTRTLSEAVAKHLLRGDVAAARSTAERSTAVASDIFMAGFDRHERARARNNTNSLETAVERERTQVSLRLKRNLWVLGTIGAVTPFVGLFGTVAGIMRSFKDLGIDVESGGSGGTSAVMTGISEALIATAAGILVAVQAVIFYNYFQARLARVAVELRLISDEFVELLRDAPAQPATSAVPSSEVPATPNGTAEVRPGTA
jgi:biopolymer transport protein ExbB